jgi:hypothetical protein
MKKQTKVLVTLSAAALLAVGFSAVSFAEGWDNSTGSWQYLDKDGEAVTNVWKTSNGQKFYLGDDGNMVVDSLIEDTTTSSNKTYYYYVDANGAMVTNTWKAVALDGDENTDLDAEYWWYYFGSDGKAYTSSDNKLTKSKIKTINGLKYAFDEEGHMVYGWVDEDDLTQNDDDDSKWTKANYYFNGWNDGHAANGWLQLDVVDDTSDETDKTYWFYFDGNGKKKKDGRKKINGKYYHFAADGHMIDDWDIDGGTWKKTESTAASISYLNGDGSERKNKWVWAVPTDDYIEKDNDDDEYSWWYFNKTGKLEANKIKKINGKKYAFDQYGRMITGLVAVDEHVHDGAQGIAKVANLGGNYKLSTDDGNGTDDWTRESWTKSDLTDDFTLYYFSEDEKKDGSMKKGYQTLGLDDGDYQFYFDASTGKAASGYVDRIKKFTENGLVLKPTSDDDSNYAGLVVTENITGNPKTATDVTEFHIGFNEIKENDVLVNKSGTIVKGNGKTAVKDSEDCYYVTDANGYVKHTFANKDLYDEWKKTL